MIRLYRCDCGVRSLEMKQSPRKPRECFLRALIVACALFANDRKMSLANQKICYNATNLVKKIDTLYPTFRSASRGEAHG